MIRSTTIMVLALAIGLVMGSAAGGKYAISSVPKEYAISDFETVAGVTRGSTKKQIRRLFGKWNRRMRYDDEDLREYIWRAKDKENEPIMSCEVMRKTGIVQAMQIGCEKSAESVAEVLAFFEKREKTRDAKIGTFLGKSIGVVKAAFGAPTKYDSEHHIYIEGALRVDFVTSQQDHDFIVGIQVQWL